MKILFYDDAREFGGHEQMTLAAVRHLAAVPTNQIGFMYFADNLTLGTQLDRIRQGAPGMHPIPRRYASGPGQILRTLWSIRQGMHLAREIRAFAPDLLVVAQGGIAHASLGLVAGRLARVRTVSYIPMTHPERVFGGAPVKSTVRSLIARLYYALPHAIYTISPRMKRYVVERGVRCPVEVIPNGIDFPADPMVSRRDARAALGLQERDIVFAIVGRLDVNQKRQDLALEAFSHAYSADRRLRLFLVGDGPDETMLRSIAGTAHLGDAIRFLPWTQDTTTIYRAVDCLLIPSRYEGVPLVMLEAMYFELPILAADVDGMADTLPKDWLFPAGNATVLANHMVRFAMRSEARAGEQLVEANRQLVIRRHSLCAFQQAFQQAICASIPGADEVLPGCPQASDQSQ